MKKQLLYFALLYTAFSFAQVGINTTTPDASSMLDISAIDKGVLVPRISLTNVTLTTLDGTNTAATGLLIWNTNATTVGGNGVGFYFFNGTQWMPITQTATGNTLDQAYDQGGAGAGKNINATDGAIRINGTDGFLVTGTYGTGNTIDTETTGDGTKMFFNPRKAAFRAGYVAYGLWDDSNIGLFSTAFGQNTQASGANSTAFGYGNYASGDASFCGGSNSAAANDRCFAFGADNFAEASWSTILGGGSNHTAAYSSTIIGGGLNETLGNSSYVLGVSNTSRSFGETVIGIGATNYLPSLNGAAQFRTANQNDRLFVIGNAIDTNANDVLEIGERSNALTIYKNGRMNINDAYNMPLTDGTANQVMKTDGAGNVTWQNTITANTLDQAYDQGGAGAGKNINATNGAVRINGGDGFLVTGTIASGSTIDAEITGTGTRMFFSPRKAAFRAGFAIGTQWNDVNLGSFSAAFGSGNTVSGEASAAFGSGNSVSSLSSAAFGEDNDASGAFNFVAGTANVTSGENSTAIGQSLTVGGDLGVALGSSNTVNSNGGIAIGSNLEVFSGYETVLGLNSTNYVPISTSGFNTNDRLLAIGNGATIASRSNALTIYKDGRMNINDAYTLPTSDGTTGQVLTTNGAGVTNWQDTHANFALAKMKIPANQAIPAASSEYLIFETIFDLNSNFNSTNNRFEVTEAGYYRVEANFNTFASYTATNSYEINIEINGLPVKFCKWNHIGSGPINRAVTTVEALSPGDYIQISVRGGSAFSINSATELTSFVVERIR